MATGSNVYGRPLPFVVRVDLDAQVWEWDVGGTAHTLHCCPALHATLLHCLALALHCVDLIAL